MPGFLIVNADDWGRDAETTDRIFECVVPGAVSSVSAMVFMQDSERAAGIAREHGIEAGLHLNFTTPFSAPGTPAPLAGTAAAGGPLSSASPPRSVHLQSRTDARLRVCRGGAARRIPAPLRNGPRPPRRASSHAPVRERARSGACFRPARSCGGTSASSPVRRACGTACIAEPWTACWPAGTGSTDRFFSLEPLEPPSAAAADLLPGSPGRGRTGDPSGPGGRVPLSARCGEARSGRVAQHLRIAPPLGAVEPGAARAVRTRPSTMTPCHTRSSSTSAAS